MGNRIILKVYPQLIILPLLAFDDPEVGGTRGDPNIVASDNIIELYGDNLFAEVIGDKVDEVGEIVIRVDEDDIRWIFSYL